MFRGRPGRTVPSGERSCLGNTKLPPRAGDWSAVGECSVGVGWEAVDGESSGVKMGIGRAFLGCGERIAGVELILRGSLGEIDRLGGRSFPGTKVTSDRFLDSDLSGS